MFTFDFPSACIITEETLSVSLIMGYSIDFYYL